MPDMSPPLVQNIVSHAPINPSDVRAISRLIDYKRGRDGFRTENTS
jgi:hypothetical protein